MMEMRKLARSVELRKKMRSVLTGGFTKNLSKSTIASNHLKSLLGTSFCGNDSNISELINVSMYTQTHHVNQKATFPAKHYMSSLVTLSCKIHTDTQLFSAEE